MPFPNLKRIKEKRNNDKGKRKKQRKKEKNFRKTS